MHFVFAGRESVDALYHSNLGIAAAFALLMAVAVLAAGMRRQVFAWKSSVAVALGIYFVCAAVVRQGHDSRFLALDATPGRLELSFPRDPSSVSVPRDQIEAVLFGYDGRYSHFCHIAVVLKGGTRYQSALLDNFHEPCREYRRRIVQMMGI